MFGPAFGASIAHGVNESTRNLATSLWFAGPVLRDAIVD